jgi:hypothetical protein
VVELLRMLDSEGIRKRLGCPLFNHNSVIFLEELRGSLSALVAVARLSTTILICCFEASTRHVTQKNKFSIFVEVELSLCPSKRDLRTCLLRRAYILK